MKKQLALLLGLIVAATSVVSAPPPKKNNNKKQPARAASSAKGGAKSARAAVKGKGAGSARAAGTRGGSATRGASRGAGRGAAQTEEAIPLAGAPGVATAAVSTSTAEDKAAKLQAALAKARADIEMYVEAESLTKDADKAAAERDKLSTHLTNLAGEEDELTGERTGGRLGELRSQMQAAKDGKNQAEVDKVQKELDAETLKIEGIAGMYELFEDETGVKYTPPAKLTPTGEADGYADFRTAYDAYMAATPSARAKSLAAVLDDYSTQLAKLDRQLVAIPTYAKDSEEKDPLKQSAKYRDLKTQMETIEIGRENQVKDFDYRKEDAAADELADKRNKEIEALIAKVESSMPTGPIELGSTGEIVGGLYYLEVSGGGGGGGGRYKCAWTKRDGASGGRADISRVWFSLPTYRIGEDGKKDLKNPLKYKYTRTLGAAGGGGSNAGCFGKGGSGAGGGYSAFGLTLADGTEIEGFGGFGAYGGGGGGGNGFSWTDIITPLVAVAGVAATVLFAPAGIGVLGLASAGGWGVISGTGAIVAANVAITAGIGAAGGAIAGLATEGITQGIVEAVSSVPSDGSLKEMKSGEATGPVAQVLYGSGLGAKGGSGSGNGGMPGWVTLKRM
ncbi:MAG: hypothetical protein LBL52_02415 [Rickettsiales bacterium]|jgi:hypothetical protein|nr:hypothetical protein [Rickettsiales bacterium]